MEHLSHPPHVRPNCDNDCRRIRDSGMPDETFWELMFDVPLILSRLEIERFHDVAELGCGYGTFSIPVARAITGIGDIIDLPPWHFGIRLRKDDANEPK